MSGGQTDDDLGALLASRLRSLPTISRQASIVRTLHGWQANCQVDGGFHVYIHDDPVVALLVATGAIPHPNLSETSRAIVASADRADATAARRQVDLFDSRLTAEDMDLLG